MELTPRIPSHIHAVNQSSLLTNAIESMQKRVQIRQLRSMRSIPSAFIIGMEHLQQQDQMDHMPFGIKIRDKD